MSIELAKGAVDDARAVELLETYESHRWHRLAALAVLMDMSGASTVLPDEPYVRAFARDNPSGKDIPTSIGAACSFSDLWFDARFYGPVAPQVEPEKTEWPLQALHSRSGSIFSERAPSRRIVRSLLNEAESPWHILMELPGGQKSELRPIVVTGQSARRVDIFDPANSELEAPTNYRLWRGQLFAAAALNSRTSLLAVRPRYDR